MDQTSSVLWRGRKGGTNVRALLCVGTVTLGAAILGLLLPNLAASAVAARYAGAVQTVMARSNIVPYTTSIPYAVRAIQTARQLAMVAGANFVAGPTPVRFVEDFTLMADAVKQNPTRIAYTKAAHTAKTHVLAYVTSIPNAVSLRSITFSFPETVSIAIGDCSTRSAPFFSMPGSALLLSFASDER